VHKRLHQIEKEGVERQFGTTIIAAKAVAATSMTWNGDGNGACRSLAVQPGMTNSMIQRQMREEDRARQTRSADHRLNADTLLVGLTH